MSLVVNTNISSNYAMNKLSQHQDDLALTFRRVSSGLRITRAADDPAGYAMGERIDSRIISSKQAGRNANDGVSILQTSESAANEVANIIKRMRELAVQSSSESLSTDDRGSANSEFQELSKEVQRIADVTEFNDIALTSSATTGWGGNASITVQIGIFGTANDRINIDLADLRSTTLGVSYSGSADSTHIYLNTTTAATSAISRLDASLSTVNSFRGTFGAVQNRLESILRTIDDQTENLQNAKSRIMDADFAYETAQMAKLQVLQQASIAILAQANSTSQYALRLIA